MEDIEIFAVNNINIINNSNVNYDNIGMQNISINTVDLTRITFIEFLDITVIDQIITNLSFSYENVLITLEWNKYPIRKSNTCIWDYPSLSQSNNNIKMFAEIQNRNDKFKKLCMNGQAYLHYLEEPSTQNIIISKRTMVICIIIIVVVIVIFIISLYFVALWKYYKDMSHQSSIKEKGSSSSDNSIDSYAEISSNKNKDTSKSNENNVNSIENEKSVEESQDINIINTPKENVNSNDNDENIDNEDINHNDDLNEQMNNEQEKDNNQKLNEKENSNLNDQNNSENDDVDFHSQSYDENNNTELNNQCNSENKNTALYNPNHSENDNAGSSDHINDLNEKIDEINDQNDDNNIKEVIDDNNIKEIIDDYNIKEVIDDDIVLSDQNEISNNNEKSQNDEKCKKNVFIMFLKHLFECGNSAGSIFTEAFELLRTFQRFSGTQTFSIHFSKDCLKLFSWASSIFESILSNFYIGTFSEIELFYLINYIVPMVIITFVVSFMWNRNFYLILLFCGVCFVLGFGFAYIKYDKKISIALIVVFLIIFILIIIYIIKNDGCMQIGLSSWQSEAESPAFLPFSFSISNTLLTISIMLVPFFLYNSYFTGSYFFICLILFILGIIIDLILMNFFKMDVIYDFFAEHITYLFKNFLSLIFIPSTDHFVALMKNEYKNNANCIFGYLVLSLLLPLTIIITLFSNEDPDIYSKYKDDFAIFEFIDFGRQIAYAFSAAYDEPWACIAFEILWIISFSIIRPFKSLCQYILQGGSSFIVILGNLIALICKYSKINFLSFEISISLACIACIPAILSFYVYFATEFEIEDEDKKGDNYVKEQISRIISYEFFVISPIAWFFYGIIVPFIMNYFNNLYDQYHTL